MMKSASQILDQTGTQLWPAQANATVFDTLKQLEEKKIRAHKVVEGDKPVGMVSGRNYVRKIILLSCFAFTGFLYLASITLLCATILPAVMPW
jgi:hypothetical protein